MTPDRRWVVDLSATALLLAVPIVGFWPTFAGPGYLVAAIGGALVGLGIAMLGAQRRWSVLVVAAATVVAYFVLGGALALSHTAIIGVIPTVETLRQLALGIVMSWKELLTTVPPVAGVDGFYLVPFLLLLVAAVLAGSLALRVRPAVWALLPAAVLLVAQIALGTSEPAAPLVEGALFAVVAAAWLALHQSWAPSQAAVPLGDEAASPPTSRNRVVLAAAVVAVAVVAGVGASAVAAPAGPRYILRDIVIPPFDVRDYPSPLQSFRGYVRDAATTPLFTVTGLPEGARVRLATMDAYSGQVFTVSDQGAGSSSAFTPLRGNMSADANGESVSVRVAIRGLTGVWMPDVGEVRSVSFDGPRADELRRTGHYNEGTDTAVVTLGLREGDAYTLETVVADTPSDASLADTPFAPLKMPTHEHVPQELADIAADATAEAETPIERVRALQSMLATDGFFSHGLDIASPSRAGHGAERILTLLEAEQMVGDDEQYAVAMALLASELGIPARVVMGFHPDEDEPAGTVFEANGDNLHAWVEVAFDGVGWVPFDPTPPEDQTPDTQTTKPRVEPKPQVLQPPPPQQDPAELPSVIPDDRDPDDDDKGDGGVLALVLAIGGVSLLLLAVLAAPFVIIGGLKAARRRRRLEAERSADRISGGWDELVDRAVDYGTALRGGATRSEDAVVVGDAFAEPRVTVLAERADAEVFGPADPSAADVDEFWRQVDEIVSDMGRSRSPWRRVRARLSLRALLAGTRFALPGPRNTAARERRAVRWPWRWPSSWRWPWRRENGQEQG
ncbi:MAG: transglutaminase-like domain-containing protein [Microbacterium sp.]|uniref:transglutaminase-like domain-containing protein n=1 Tax=Microbacterium sp. TaxID=51671 RepID=UPI0039E35D65